MITNTTRITSTPRGVQRLEQGGVRAAFMGAVQAAAERNEELGKK